MHPSALFYAKAFFNTYAPSSGTQTVIDIGAQNVNGSIRDVVPERMHYIGVDFTKGPGVDIVLDDPYALPFADASVDIVTCSSCYEHADMFWLSFLEAIRVLKPEGLLYINTPSNGHIHRWNVDSWRFYPDSGQSLVRWARRNGYNPVLLESFIGDKIGSGEEGRWNDCVCIFGKEATRFLIRPAPLCTQLGGLRHAHAGDTLLAGQEDPRSPDQILQDDLARALECTRYRLRQCHDTHRRLRKQAERRERAGRERIHALSAAHTEITTRIAALEQQIATSGQERSRLHAAEVALQSRLDALHASRSWRCTAPFRMAGHAARHARKALGMAIAGFVHAHGRNLYRSLPLRHRDRALRLAGPLVRRLGIPVPPRPRGGTCPSDHQKEIRIRFDELGTRPSPATPDVAIVIHAHYLDIFAEICAMLPADDAHAGLFVTVSSEQDRIAAARLVRQHTRIRHEIRVCQNRGRNFGPWLVEFARDIADYDLILHLHTKKSLRTGEDQSAWRGHLFRNLIGTPGTVGLVRAFFMRHPEVGILAPVTYDGPGMAWWFHHWLSVGHLLEGFFARLGIRDYPRRGFIDFPVGAMFWARTSALAPLLDGNWSYEDFDPEPAPDDGTLAHVIERAISVIAQSGHYRHAEIDADRQSIRIGPGNKLLHQYTRFSDMLKELPYFKVYSFDFFDTLCTRLTSHPGDLLHYVGHVLQTRHGFSSPAHFTDSRKAAEARARASLPHGEAGLDDIYAALRELGWTEEQAAQAQATELALERACTIPRQAVIDVLTRAHQAGKTIILVSDTYFPRAYIDTLLDTFGIRGMISELFLSSERKARKDRGDIWDQVFARYDRRTVLHIGDNEQSDVQQPIRHGASAIGVMNPAILANLKGLALPHQWLADRHRWEDGILLGPVINKIGGNPFTPNLDHHLLTSATELGYAVYGPIVFAFTNWLRQQCLSEGIDHVAFLSRDGYHLKSFFDQACAIAGTPLRSSYLYCSRMSTLAALLGQSFDMEELLAGKGGFKGTARALLLHRTGFDAGPRADMPVRLPGSAASVQALLAEVQPAFDEHVRTQYHHFSRYLHDHFGDAGNIALVDLGFGGTIQRRIQKILHRGVCGFYMATNADASCVNSLQGRASGFFCDEQERPGYHPYIKTRSLALEAVFSAPHSQTRGYDGQGPVFTKTDPETGPDSAESVMQGVQQYIDDLHAHFGKEVFSLACDEASAQAPFAMLIEGRFRIGKQLAGLFRVEDHYCGNGEINVLDYINLAQS